MFRYKIPGVVLIQFLKTAKPYDVIKPTTLYINPDMRKVMCVRALHTGVFNRKFGNFLPKQ